MDRGLKAALLMSGASMGFLIAAPATAQTASDESATGDIIVTARRTEERLQDVPISITVFNQEQITNRNIVVASDLATFTPSLSVNTRFGLEKAAFSIRGFNQDASTAPTVGVYFADVIGLRAQGGTTSGNSAAAGSFTDLQNVQVLKGPQGTLFGRNTTGGAVLLVPQQPTDNLEGYIEGTYGNFDNKRVQAAINLPLADTFKVRLSVDRNKRDGYLINRSDIGPDAYNDTNYTYVRLSVLADLTPDLQNSTVAYYSHSKTQGAVPRLVICNPAPNLAFPSSVTAAAACDQIARATANGWTDLTDVDAFQGDQSATGVLINQWQVINTTTWRASDNLTVKNVASYGEFRENSSFSLNGDNFFVPGTNQRFNYIAIAAQPGYDAAAQSTATEELQLQGQSGDGKLTYVVGGYLEFSRPMGFNQNRTNIFGNCSNAGLLQCAAPLGFVSISQSRTQLSFDNHGVFAQGTYDFSDQLALTLGGRWTFDKTIGYSEGTRITLAPVPGVGVIPVSQPCNDAVRHPGVDVIRSGGNLSVCGTRIVAKSDAPTWLVGVDYKPTDDILLYAKYSRGYRQGGINFTNPGLETWQPEKVDAYEIGAKASFRGAISGYFNIAAFYNQLNDQQVFAQAISRVAGVSGGNVVINAGKSVIKGFEVDASATVFDSLRFDLGYAYLDAKVKEIATEAQLAPLLDDPNVPFGRLIPLSLPGDPITYTPEHKLTLTATYTLPLDESLGKLSISGIYNYTSSIVAATLVASPIGVLPATNLFNLNVNWNRIGGSPIDIGAFATNITNEKYPVAIGSGYNSAGFDSYFAGQPRIYGVRVRYQFGQ